jgi:hypothetical protein
MIQVLDEQTIEVNLPSKIGYERVAMASSAALAKIGGLPPARIEDHGQFGRSGKNRRSPARPH